MAASVLIAAKRRFLGGCIFPPVLFSPRQTDGGVVYMDGKMLPPPPSTILILAGAARARWLVERLTKG